MAAGAPVIGIRRGGLLDSLRCLSSGIDAPTGIFVPKQTVSSLMDTVNWFEDARAWKKFSAESIRRWAEKFSLESFNKHFQDVLLKAWEIHQMRCDVAFSDPNDSQS